MKSSWGLSDSVAGVSESPAECRQCGATTRLGNGLCLSCTLREGLEGDREASRESFEAILAEDEVRDTHWRVGNYEILEEIGRGGMGVIYRARQRHSRRIVALKRMVSYQADSRETLERFRREAEAAASLDHPNILPIYEVGQGEDGLPFFSMKYAAGGSLQKAGPALRNEPRQSVQLVAKVARAVQYAHEHGVLHRDLKPGNILLDGHGEPFVSDFGLAKWLDTSTDLTRTLTIFGTPGYIAPEQAKGPAAKLTPAADVYSLGAVLFDLFTGRPPFLGEHALAVIQQASEKPAPKLRSIAPTLDRDLETICARCLERDPQARYRSGSDLAVDLERWLEGRPIIARRVSPPVRAWRWSKRNPKLAAATAAAFCSAMAAGFLFFSRNGLVPQSGLLPPKKSIAVLPFENLSRDSDNAYFAEGIQDEILTRLSKIADLKVISRTSTQHYKSAPENLSEIAKQLGVANILEGSVQKSGDAVRVNVQLIKAETDSHLWADTFDRKLTDIFLVESDVAKAIADQLGAKLTGREEQIISSKPTDNPEAYDAYLRGLAYSLKTANTNANVLNAQKYLREAVRLDPKFALSWALLSFVESRGYGTVTLQPTDALRQEARQAAETALSLQPNLGEAILAKGFYHYACLKDYDTAVRYFEQARQFLPNSSRIPESLAYVTRRQGKWDRSEMYFNQAERLDPRNVSLLTQHALSYKDRRRFLEALRKLEQILNITPDDVDTIVEKASIAQAEGDLPRASALLASVQPAADDTNALETQAYQAILERRPAPIISQLKVVLANPDAALGFYKGGLRFWLGWTQDVIGDHVAAKESWQQARRELEPFLTEQPENHILLGDLAMTAMSLGDKAAALDFSERAMAALPVEKDAVRGPATIEFLARVAANVGEPDRAITALESLLSIPYSGALGPGAPLTPALLRLDPMFDPLRSDPRFEKMVKEAKEPDATTVPAKSIAVLPFENLSRDPGNAYFAEGVQDEILTRLSKIADLKVISRTSTAKYKSKLDNIKKVAEELGVSTILEGSVQKAGDKVRINVQLIDARADTHLWAKSYDRDLKDVFAVESEVSQEIADTLRVNLSPAQSGAMASAPTKDTEAYDLFLRGEYEFHQAGISVDAGAAADRADAFYRRALARDPNFVAPAAQLARSRLYRHWYVSPLAPAELEEVKAIIDRTLALAPNSPEAHLALGLFFYWGHRQYEMALAEFKRTLELQPNNVDARAYCAWIHRRRGEWEPSLADSQRAQELDPRDASIPQNIGVTYLALRLWKEAEQAELRALALDAQNTVAAVILVNARLCGTGDASLARRALNDFPETIKSLTTTLYGRRGVSSGGEVAAITGIWVYLDIIERRFSDAFQAFENAAGNDERGHLQLLAGRVALRVLAGEAEAAKTMGEEALPLLEAKLSELPDDTFAMTELSWVYLALGRTADALRVSKKAADLISIEKDALDGAIFQNGLAQIEARAGAPEEAIKRLRRLLSIPGGHRLSIARLKNDPVWDPIRNRPDFQELLSGPEQIGPIKASTSGPDGEDEALAGLREKSIAVLPFENRSRDPDNAFFTDGIQDEILTDLARIADLKVISRTSVMPYKTGLKRNLRQIGKELGVAHVVEGSVQRAGNRVRVNAQLIDARTDAHLWAQTYDRDLADVFAIQSEIAKAIADQLQAKLSPTEKSAIEQPPTTDITAFNLYSHAKNLFLTAFAGANGRADLLQAADLLKQAVARDPSFFQAYCQLAFTEINIYGIVDHSPEHLAQAEAALQSAARLRPDAGETHLAHARNLYWGYLDYDGALRELEIARQTLPGEDWIFSLKGYIERRQGRWEECIRDLERATELDPRNVLTPQQLALTYQQLRRYAEEKSTYERILAFEPNDPVTKSAHAFVELDSKADTRPLHEVTDSVRDKNPAALSSIADNWLLCALAERDPAVARKALIALGENPASLAPIADVRFNRSFMEGVIARLAKDGAKAQAAFTAARAEQEKSIQAQPNYGPTVCVLGLIDAALGRKQEALREGRRAVELLPVEKDALRGIAMVKYLAMIAAWVGDKDLAYEQLAITIRNPSDLSYGQLKLMPFWDPLRGDPRFEKLVEEVKQPVALSASTSAFPGRAKVTPAPEKSIAVLPFENLSRDPDNAFLTDGVHEEILTDLARIADLKVISRSSVMQYDSRVKPNLRKIANELGVAHVLEGSVQRAGNRVRVNAQLIDARNDAHLWAQTYDRELTDIFAVESDIASTIANTLQAKLTGSERKAITSKATENPEAYQLYLRGRFFWNKRTAPDLRKAIDLFQEAVAKDPHYAQAYAAIAQSWVLLPAYEDSAPNDCFPKAQTAAEKALALDQSLSDAHTALAAVKVLYNFDPSGSIAEFEQAIKLNPNDATAHHWLGNHPLTAIGDLDRALAEVRRAQELDPLSLIINTNVGWGLLIKGRYDEAVAQLRKTIEMDGTFYYARYILGQTLQLSGHIAEAEKEYKKAIELATDPVPLAYLAHLYGTNGRQEEARKILSQLLEMRKQHYVDAYCLAIVYLGLGDRAEAMNWLEQGYRDRNGDELVSLRGDPFLAPLRGDPRFEALAEKIVPAREFKGRVASE